MGEAKQICRSGRILPSLQFPHCSSFLRLAALLPGSCIWQYQSPCRQGSVTYLVSKTRIRYSRTPKSSRIWMSLPSQALWKRSWLALHLPEVRRKASNLGAYGSCLKIQATFQNHQKGEFASWLFMPVYASLNSMCEYAIKSITNKHWGNQGILCLPPPPLPPTHTTDLRGRDVLSCFFPYFPRSR